MEPEEELSVHVNRATLPSPWEREFFGPRRPRLPPSACLQARIGELG